MTLTTGRSAPTRRSEAGLSPGGFTLIELILVMGLLALVAAFAAPSLLHSLGYQGLREESRRFIGLTRYARDEAISSGMYMEVWVNPDEGQYGVRAMIPASSSDTTPQLNRTYELSKWLHFEVPDNNTNAPSQPAATPWSAGATTESTDATSSLSTTSKDNGEITARFWPDGTLDENSFQGVTIVESNGTEMNIVRSQTQPGYEIENTQDDDTKSTTTQNTQTPH